MRTEAATRVCTGCGTFEDIQDASPRDRQLQQTIDRQLRPRSAEGGL
jgi:hypothetical protein